MHRHIGRSLVHNVDGLVGQIAVGDVALGEDDHLADELVGNFDAVVALVIFFDALEDLDCRFDRRLVDDDRLEAPLERRVVFDVLAVLGQRRRADDLNLPARKRRL